MSTKNTSKMYQALSGKDKSYQIENKNKALQIDGQALNWDIIAVADGKFHIIAEGKSYNAELVSADHATKNYTFKINGALYPVTLKDQQDLLLEKMGLNNLASAKVNEIKAPMPGLIFDIKVKEGDQVAKGEAVMILEAMKMENIIKSPTDGLIKSIKVKKGDSVEKNQIMIQFA